MDPEAKGERVEESEKLLPYIPRTYLDCYCDSVMGLRGAIRQASSPKCYDPTFWEKSAADWTRQAIQNYRRLVMEFERNATLPVGN